MATVGFDGSSLTIPTDVPVPQINSNKDMCVSSAADTEAPRIRLLNSNMDALRLVGFASTEVPVCVLPGDPSKKEKREFSDCLAESSCEEWTKYQDENNGNVAMICHDG